MKGYSSSSDQLCGRQSGNQNKLNLSAFERFSYPYQVEMLLSDLIVESDKQRLTRYSTNLVEIRSFFDYPGKQLQMRKHIFDMMFCEHFCLHYYNNDNSSCLY